MKKQLQKKVFAILIVMFVCVTVSNAQIIYTDLNPDVTITRPVTSTSSPFYTIDFNNDGQIDVSLNARRTGTGTIADPRISRVRSNYIASSQTLWINNINNSWSTALAIDTDSIIGSGSLFWSPSPANSSDLLRSYITSNLWPVNVDRFLGVRFLVGADWFYGWVRISIINTISFTVKDYAYNSTPNQPILAGETITLGINENPVVSQISIFPNPVSNQLTISLGKLQPEVEVSITDTTGKTVYKIKEITTQKIEVNTNDFSSGIYLVQIKATDFIETKKLIVKK